jgi:hypothetical protein
MDFQTRGWRSHKGAPNCSPLAWRKTGIRETTASLGQRGSNPNWDMGIGTDKPAYG